MQCHDVTGIAERVHWRQWESPATFTWRRTYVTQVAALKHSPGNGLSLAHVWRVYYMWYDDIAMRHINHKKNKSRVFYKKKNKKTMHSTWRHSISRLSKLLFYQASHLLWFYHERKSNFTSLKAKVHKSLVMFCIGNLTQLKAKLSDAQMTMASMWTPIFFLDVLLFGSPE